MAKKRQKNCKKMANKMAKKLKIRKNKSKKRQKNSDFTTFLCTLNIFPQKNIEEKT